ncbi:MAG: hypothetical protein JZU53_12415 [Paludibacter sp.]|nr:hypothetical protein [Paludibacter sp.]
MRIIRIATVLSIMVLTVSSVKAQFATGADIVSSYVWRGIPQDGTSLGGTPNIQPYAAFTTGKLTLGSWASGSFTGAVKEVDLYASLAVSSKFAITLTDYYYNFAGQPNYFKYNNGTGHVFEGTLAYTGSAFSASVNTMFAGADKKVSGDNALSTYVELGYQIAPVAKIFIGGSLGESQTYATTGFGITNLGIKVSKSIAITDKFSLPIYAVVGANPYAKTTFFVAGVTL